MAETNPAAPGSTTSEFRLGAVVMVVGLCLEAAAGILHGLQDTIGGAAWFPTVLAVLGALIQVATFLGYNKGRVLTKAALVAADAPVIAPPKT
jgi:hypothetical protein